MDPVSPIPAVVCLALAIATANVLVKRFGRPLIHDRYSSIDGLRGYLAFFVFLHHSSIWYFYLHTDQWKVPPSNIYTHFGQSSVALFFMITGFLFFSKLIDGRNKAIDWGRLFVSRILRLVPLYIFAMTIMFFMVMVMSESVLKEPIIQFIKGCIRWLGFTVFGAPDLNGVQRTSILIAGVTWSLPYEWLFYFSLPALAWLVGIRPPRTYLALSLLITIWLFRNLRPDIHHLSSFGGGIAAAFLVRSTLVKEFAASKSATLIIVGLIALMTCIFNTTYSLIPIFLLSIVFVLIACGNTLFGILVHPVSHTIGEMAYSIYLLHGLMLFTVFHLLIGPDRVVTYSPSAYWAIVALTTPFLIFGSFSTYYFIERPAMERTTSTIRWMRSLFAAIFKREVTQR